jgi:hypothetical protein
MVTTQVPTAPGGRFAKDQFRIDLQAQTVTCPAQVTVAIIPASRGGRARFGVACSVCPLRDACTTSVRGRVVAIHPHEAELTTARIRQRDPVWRADYRATRPKVERKLAHLLRRRHGGRRKGPGSGARDPGLQAAGWGGQPGPVRHPRAALHSQRLADAAGVIGPPGRPGPPALTPQNMSKPSENTGHLEEDARPRRSSLTPTPGRHRQVVRWLSAPGPSALGSGSVKHYPPSYV